MTTVQHVLGEKRPALWTTTPTETVLSAIRLMADKDIGALIVMEDDRIVGIVTERHYARNVVLKGKASPTTKVGDIMEPHAICVTTDNTVDECMALMTDKRVRHLPVMADGKVIGIVSIGDLVKSIIRDQAFTIAQLEHYIRS